jgi:restriction system protein
LNLSYEVLDETLKSGGNKFHNQVVWARQYLVWEGLLDSSKHGTWKLTNKGKEIPGCGTHGFVKKTDKVSPKEIEKAEQIRANYFEKKRREDEII